jgi:hypothetical protein
MAEDMSCALCLEILHNPVTVVPCQHNFCAGCYTGCMGQQQCPLCRERVHSIGRNHNLCNIISTFLDGNPDRKRDPEDLKDLNARDKLTADKLRELIARQGPSGGAATGAEHSEDAVLSPQTVLYSDEDEDDLDFWDIGEDAEDEEEERLSEHVQEMVTRLCNHDPALVELELNLSTLGSIGMLDLRV